MYLIDEMHVGLRQIFQPRELTIQPVGVQIDVEQLKLFAHEAATMGENELAKLYHRVSVQLAIPWMNIDRSGVTDFYCPHCFILIFKNSLSWALELPLVSPGITS